MVKVSDIPKLIKNLKDPGYSSIYAFSEEDAQKIKESGSSRGMGQYAVGSSALFIDIDKDNIQEAAEIKDRYSKILKDKGLTHYVWFSGSKGFHLEIPHEWMYDHRLPYSHAQAVESLGFSEYDRTLYQHGRIFSLPGRVHPKTGKRKELIEDFLGSTILEVPLIDKKMPVFNFTEVEKTLESALGTLWYLSSTQPKTGSRHTLLWGAAKDCAAAGIAYETALDMLQEINKTWDQSKDQSEVERAVQQAYVK